MPADKQGAVQLEIEPTAATGLRTLALLGSAVFLTLLLSYLLFGGEGDLLAQRTTLTTYLPDGTGLSTDSEVRLSGIRIGKVSGVGFSGLLDPQRAIRVELRILKRYLKNIPADSQTDIDTDTLVGYAFIDINEGKSPAPVGEDGVLQSEPLKQAVDRADQLRVLQNNFTQIDRLLVQASSPDTELGKFIYGSGEYDQFVSGVGDFERTMRALITPQSQLGQALYSLDMYNRIHGAITGIDAKLQGIQNGQGTAGKLFASDDQYNDLVRQLSDLRATLADMNAGKGAAGALLHDDENYRNIQRMLASTDSLLTSLNAGEGRAGELLASPQLYESLRGSLAEIEKSLKDLRENPKKYLRLRIF